MAVAGAAGRAPRSWDVGSKPKRLLE